MPSSLRVALANEIGELWVVVPAVHQSHPAVAHERMTKLGSGDEAASSTADALPSQQTESSAGESDPLLAIEDALRYFVADEVVVITRPTKRQLARREQLRRDRSTTRWPQDHSTDGERQRLTAATWLCEDVDASRVSMATDASSSSRSSSRP